MESWTLITLYILHSKVDMKLKLFSATCITKRYGLETRAWGQLENKAFSEEQVVGRSTQSDTLEEQELSPYVGWTSCPDFIHLIKWHCVRRVLKGTLLQNVPQFIPTRIPYSRPQVVLHDIWGSTWIYYEWNLRQKRSKRHEKYVKESWTGRTSKVLICFRGTD